MRLISLLLLLPFLAALSCAGEGERNGPLSEYVSPTAIAAVKINHLSALRDSLETNDFISRFEDLESFKAILAQVTLLEHVDQESKGIMVFSKVEGDSVDFLYISDNLENIFGSESLQNKYSEAYTYNNRSLQKLILDDRVIYSIIFDQKLFVSSSPKFLDEAMELPKGHRTNSDLERLFSIADSKKAATIFINLNQSDSLVSRLLKDSQKTAISKFSDWVALDIDCRTNQISVNGLSLANDSVPNYLSLFRNTKPLPNVTASFAPLQSEGILSFSFDDHDVLEKNRKRYLSLPPTKDVIFNAVEEVGLIYVNGERAVILNTIGSDRISDFLAGKQKNATDYQGNIILEHSDVDFLNTAFRPLVQNFEARFSTVLDNAFVFSEKLEVLQTIISNFKNGATFDKSPTYMEAASNMSSAASIQLVWTSDYTEQFLKDDFIADIYKDLKDPKFSGYVLMGQVVADGDFYLTNLSAQKIAKVTRVRSVGSIFTVPFEEVLANDPQFVTNHITKKKEIVVQDQKNVLYLISNDGKIVWKKPLGGKIQGKIQQVDLFKNGRLQLAFTTNSQLVVLDRNGKEVAMLTKTYPGGNLNPLAVFDYDGKREYRLVVTQGNNIYMYDRKGKIVNGFKFKKSDQPIMGAPKHIVIGNKDYLVFKLADGRLKILSRTGDVRVNVREKIDFSGNEVLSYKNQFAITDKKGMLYQINTNGKITKTNLDLHQDHGIDATDNTFVYMNDNVLSVKGTKITLDLGVYTPPKIFYLFNKVYVAVTDIQNQKVYLFDSQAKLIPNFPVYGSSLIDLDDLDGDRKLELVTKEGDQSLMVYHIE